MRWMNIQERFKNRGNEDNTYIYVSVGSPMSLFLFSRVKTNKIRL